MAGHFCSHCNQELATAASLRRHERTKHQGPAQGQALVHHCNQEGCDFSHGRQDVVTAHLSSHHNIYRDGDPKRYSTSAGHLARKQHNVLVWLLVEESTNLCQWRERWVFLAGEWDSLGGEPRVPQVQGIEAIGPPVAQKEAEDMTKAKLVEKLVAVRTLLFGPAWGTAGNMSIFTECASLEGDIARLREMQKDIQAALAAAEANMPPPEGP